MDGGPALTIAAGRARRANRRRNLAEAAEDEEYSGGSRRLKLKVGQGGGPGANPQDSVGWDRELDSDPDEPLAVEEQFILRVPPELAPKLRDQVDRRDVPTDVWFKFKDSRRAVFHLGNKLYSSKLVDLPALVESQRLTGVGGQTVKVADISQMLLVEEEIRDESQATRDKVFNIEDFVYPHGITPPLKHVRKRRFRRRTNRRTIEQVEEAVEKLLLADTLAEKSTFEMLDYDVPSDDEDYDPTQQRTDLESVGAPTPRPEGGISSPAPFGGDGDDDDRDGDDDEDESDEEGGSGYDSDLAKEIELGLNAGAKPGGGAAGTDDSGSDDDGDGLFGGSSDEDDDDELGQEEAVDAETLEARKRLKLLAEEMADLDKAIVAKQAELSRAPNPIFKKRFEDQIKKFHADRDNKQAQHTSIARELDARRAAAAAAATAEAADPPTLDAVVQPGASGGGTPAAMDLS